VKSSPLSPSLLLSTYYKLSLCYLKLILICRIIYSLRLQLLSFSVLSFGTNNNS
jgi:hypothetical protein